jgi:His-Xaa-Ser system radical SAM maturase HxsB
MARVFYPPDQYKSSETAYRLLPFRFLRLEDGSEIIVNEVGEFVLAPNGTVSDLVKRRLAPNSDLYATLRSRQFLADNSSAPLLDLLATKYRTKYSFIDGFTKLHIFVVTLRCDHSCQYCQVSRQTADKTSYDMSLATAERSVELMMCSPSRTMTLEFQGGESLLAMNVIQHIVPLAKKRAKALEKDLDIVVCTNLANVTDDMLGYFRDENIQVSTSLDGPEFIHNANRPRYGNNSYELTIRNIDRARRVLGEGSVAALMTTTQLSLQHPIEIIDEYVRQGFHSIFLRPISPYGFAVRTKERTGYRFDAFLDFYRTGLSHIIEINKRGYNLSEAYSKILLTKMLTPYGTGHVNLQSPDGAGINVLVYNYDGDIYATDESRMLAEMGDHTFRLGNVHTHGHRDIFTGDPFLNLISSACNQSLAGCSDCAFQTYCGSDSVFNYATQGDVYGHRPTSDFCKRNMEMIKHLFALISKRDPEIMRIFFAWIRNTSLCNIAESSPS